MRFLWLIGGIVLGGVGVYIALMLYFAKAFRR